MSTPLNVAGALAQALAESGVRRIYGLPGGGSSLDVIEAAAARGIDFVLTRTENAAVMMAGAMAEVTGVPGVAAQARAPAARRASPAYHALSINRLRIEYPPQPKSYRQPSSRFT